MNEPRVVESVTNECQSLGRAHESSSARAEQLIACLEGEIAKRDARIAELEARYQRDVYGLNNEGDPIGGDPAGGYANDNARLRAELSAIKAQEPVGSIEIQGTGFMCAPFPAPTWAGGRQPAVGTKLYAAPVSEAKAQEPVAAVKHGPLDSDGWPEFVRVETIGDFDLENLPNGMKFYAAPVSEAKAQGVERAQWQVRYLKAETVSDGWWQDSSEQRVEWCAEVNQQQHAKGLPDTWEIRRFTIAAPVQQPRCKTCDDNGLIGGPSFYAPDEGGEPCPDCCAPVQQVSVRDVSSMARILADRNADACNVNREDNWAIYGRDYIDDVTAMLADSSAAPAADAWIPVSERLPNIAQEVIAHSEFDGVCAGVLDSYGEWFAPCSEYKLVRVTSWMPMPTKIEANRHD